MYTMKHPEILVNVERVFATKAAFAAKRYDGKVFTWGNCHYGGCIPSSLSIIDERHQQAFVSNIAYIVPSPFAFIALTTSKELISWGHKEFGGNMTLSEWVENVSRVQHGDVIAIRSTTNAVAALTTKGRVFTWGSKSFGGDSNAVRRYLQANITALYSNNYAFAATNVQGDIIVWGDPASGGQFLGGGHMVKSTGSNRTIFDIASTRSAFACLYSNGSALIWGRKEEGGSVPTKQIMDWITLEKIAKVVGNEVAFLAEKLTVKGSQKKEWTVWGHPIAVGDKDGARLVSLSI
jgi:alpha-tubulin suppressor-like RCC1 family protein